MPRHAQPPRLELDRKGSGIWYATFREAGRRQEISTGTRDSGEAEAWFADWLRRRGLRAGPRDPSQVAIRDCLMEYAEKRAPQTADPVRIALAIEAMLPFWGDLKVSAITRETSERYVRDRMAEIAARRGRIAREAAERRSRWWKGGAPRPPSEGTPRRELGVLNAAIGWCVAEGMLVYGRAAVLPSRPPARHRWLTRQEVASGMRAARRDGRSRHIADFARIALRTGARKGAVLTLRWTQNTEGGWVDLERGRIDFNPVDRKQTKKRRPVIPIPPGMLCWLRAKRERALTDFVVERRLWRVVDGRRRLVGEPVGDVKRLDAVFARAGVSGVTPHTYRHTAATWMMQDAVPIWEAAGYLGMEEETLRENYGHHHVDYLQAAKGTMS